MGGPDLLKIWTDLQLFTWLFTVGSVTRLTGALANALHQNYNKSPTSSRGSM